YGSTVSPKGMTYGATLGYNWQAGPLVYGLEADYSLSDVKGSVTTCGGVVGLTCETSNTWLATFRGRAGYAFDRFMPYVTGGGAYGNIKATLNPFALTSTESKFGYTFGAGLEYAFPGNWTAKIEYLYVNLGKFDTGFTTPLVNEVSFSESIVRVGLNYKFTRW
ncbi:MAG TPA: outer membrane protein, partial [Reyranella sp.]|nr:outer membrane protein [Reyranella sp.]